MGERIRCIYKTPIKTWPVALVGTSKTEYQVITRQCAKLLSLIIHQRAKNAWGIFMPYFVPTNISWVWKQFAFQYEKEEVVLSKEDLKLSAYPTIIYNIIILLSHYLFIDK